MATLPGRWPSQEGWRGCGCTWPGSRPLCLCLELAVSPPPPPEGENHQSDDSGSTASTAQSKMGNELRASEFLCVLRPVSDFWLLDPQAHLGSVPCCSHVMVREAWPGTRSRGRGWFRLRSAWGSRDPRGAPLGLGLGPGCQRSAAECLALPGVPLPVAPGQRLWANEEAARRFCIHDPPHLLLFYPALPIFS